MKHAIVTGATGFVGRRLVMELVKNNIPVTAVVRKISGKAEFFNMIPSVVPVVCTLEDISKLPEILGQAAPDTVFCHLAWQGTAGNERADYSLQLQNVLYTIEALKAAQKMGCEGFVGAGSLMEYESTVAIYHQKDSPGQGNIYSTAKLTAHYMSRIVAANTDIRFVWPYITNAYGEEEVSPRLLNSVVRKMLSGEKLSFSAATQIYDFIHIADVAKAFYLLCQHGKNGKTYCIGSGKHQPLKNFIIQMRDLIAPGASLQFGERPGICLDARHFDTTPLYVDTGFQPDIPFQEGILRLKRALLSNHFKSTEQ